MMTDQWFAPDLVFDGQCLREGMALGVEAGSVTSLIPMSDLEPGLRPTPVGGVVTPGYVDLQVNGGGGVLVNETPTRDGLLQIAAAHREFGTVAIFPTVITDAPEVLEATCDAMLETYGEGGIAGLHIEGPHIALARRGTHAARYVRPFESATLAAVTRLRAAGVPVMITVAPEVVTPDQISELAATGAVVSMGHSQATATETRAARAAGASCVTHLFNAMPPMENRAPGLLGAAINSDLYTGIICDGIHVADEMVGLALRARPEPDRMFLVSDAMPTIGGPSSYKLYDMVIELKDGRLVNAEGSLAGAHVTQAEAVRRLVEVIGVPVERALRMAVTVPSRVMGLENDLTRLEGRSLDDVILLDADLNFRGSLSDIAASNRLKMAAP
jgi:N-acetylglucosamine-6-phosphate deacetylase